MFSLICVWINGWVNNRAGDLSRYRAHHDVTVMLAMADVISRHLNEVSCPHWWHLTGNMIIKSKITIQVNIVVFNFKCNQTRTILLSPCPQHYQHWLYMINWSLSFMRIVFRYSILKKSEKNPTKQNKKNQNKTGDTFSSECRLICLVLFCLASCCFVRLFFMCDWFSNE